MTLEGKTIVLAVTGSIAAVETIKLAHALRRRGASVKPVMSQAACGIIHPDALTYACGRETITRISGLVEHVQYCGDDGEADLLLIAPCTANSISKIACGIDDTPVTTFATTALGRRMPVLVVPAMHHAMYRHQVVMENLDKLPVMGIFIVPPRVDEGKAKIAEVHDIVLWCERLLSGQPLAGKRVLITSGRCEEPVDDVRVLTTRSSGLMGKELAYEAFRLGADVTIIHRDTISVGRNIGVSSAASMASAVESVLAEGQVDLYISAAAVSDYAPEQVQGKIPSGKTISISLLPLPKIIDRVLGSNTRVIAFKLGSDAVIEGKTLLDKGASMVCANDQNNLGSSVGTYTLIDRYGKEEVSGSKEVVAVRILNRLLSHNSDT